MFRLCVQATSRARTAVAVVRYDVLGCVVSRRHCVATSSPGVPRCHPAANPLDRVFEEDVSFFAHELNSEYMDLPMIELGLPDRFLHTPREKITVFATPERRELAKRVLGHRCSLLEGPQGVGKSYFAAGLVQELRKLEPGVPVMYLPYADFGTFEAAFALIFALEKAKRPVNPELRKHPTLLDVEKEMYRISQEAHGLRLVIDQMHTAFRNGAVNRNYELILSCNTWSLLVTSLTTQRQVFKYDMPVVDYGASPLNERTGVKMLETALHADLKDQAANLYKLTNGNPLQLDTLAVAIRKCATQQELDEARDSWFEASTQYVQAKVLADRENIERSSLNGWLCRDQSSADPRFFVKGAPLFPAVDAAMERILRMHPEEADPERLTETSPTWVIQLSNMRCTNQAFSVKASDDTVDDLKDAIKAEAPCTVTCDADQLTIYAPDPKGDVEVVLPGGATTKYTKVVRQSTALEANTEETPYLFQLPKS